MENKDGSILAIFDCPGCGFHHSPNVGIKTENFPSSWTFEGGVDNPTFRPSLLVNGHNPEMTCHSYVTAGHIEFLLDCFHSLAGKTVELPEETWSK